MMLLPSRFLFVCCGFCLLTIMPMTALALAFPKSYQYFAYGSNMVESTLTALRQVTPLTATAAILPNYKLCFNIGGGGGFLALDGAAASVQAASGESVHGVLYELTPNDFAKVGSTEGVPLAYRWERCQVYPYVGDGESAGELAASDSDQSVEAFTLVKSFPSAPDRDYPPSRSYLNLLIQGAKEWKLDRSFLEQLEATSVARHLLVKNGLAGPLLKFAELRQGRKSR